MHKSLLGPGYGPPASSSSLTNMVFYTFSHHIFNFYFGSFFDHAILKLWTKIIVFIDTKFNWLKTSFSSVTLSCQGLSTRISQDSPSGLGPMLRNLRQREEPVQRHDLVQVWRTLEDFASQSQRVTSSRCIFGHVVAPLGQQSLKAFGENTCVGSKNRWPLSTLDRWTRWFEGSQVF